MSLHTLANQLQGAGRGEDKMLVHMTPGEVGGLQQLAMAHGGSLSINPQTGLPEAGILGRLLPTVLGFALGPAGMGISFGGLSSAASAGLISGAVGTLATGSLGKGIMAGMGAYGGASLGGALKGMGGPSVPVDFGPGAGPNLGGGTYFNPPSLANQVASTASKMTPGVEGSQILANANAKGFNVPIPETKPFANWAQGNLTGGVRPLDVKVSAPEDTFGSRMGAAGRGLRKVFEGPETAFDFAKENMPSLAAIATSMSSDITAGPPKEKEKSKGMEKYRYVYDRDPVGVASSRSSERDYFPNARYEPTGEYYAASGGLMALANGGPIEEMSRLNSIGANTGYPMANQMSSSYASPAERPISENIISPQGDANVDPYTGAEKFADGGYTRYTGTRPLDEDKDDYYYVPGTASGSGYYMVRDGTQGNGFNSASFGKPGYEMAKGSAQGGGSSGGFNYFDPSYYNPQTGTYGGKPATTKAPTLGTEAVEQTRETLNPMYQKYFGRDIDESGLAAYTARPFSESELDKIFTGAGEYQTAAPLRAAREQEAAAKEREANLATPEQAADIYERVMGRTPDLPGLEYYAKTNRMTPEEMEKSLRGSDEYFKNLAKPFVPAITYGDDGRASIEGAPKYDPSQYGFAAGGGISDLGGYSDGGRLLKGPGDGVSDSIPAVIGQRQPARLADGEFVIPARIVSELGNGSTDAGARKLYAMMERIQSARKKSVGKGRVAANTKSEKYLPA
jgi:hypothetical protein